MVRRVLSILEFDVPRDGSPSEVEALKARFLAVREQTEALAAPFSAEDLCVQTMPDVSPGKWHLAHVTWFWETFLLTPLLSDYVPFDPRFNYLFNSYYNAIGERHARPERGFLTRPGLDDVMAYRRSVTEAVCACLDKLSPDELEACRPVLETGFAHEEQHQELFLTDIKHVLSKNSFPEAGYDRPTGKAKPFVARCPDPDWVRFEAGLDEFGHAGGRFAFDNEGPRHKAWLEGYALASRPVSNAEYLAFIEDGGYLTPQHWLSDGWAVIQTEGRSAPLYWEKSEAGWSHFTLHGVVELDPDAPACHLDYYEASAFAAWAGCRLPEEREWERAAQSLSPATGRWADPGGVLTPRPAMDDAQQLKSMFGEVWEWTRSAYAAYPGYTVPDGAIGEYNGKFMCGQFVLKGGSCLTPPDHLRTTYRNFFPPDAQWQMTGLRLAKDL